MTRERDLGSDVEVQGFIKFRHAGRTKPGTGSFAGLACLALGGCAGEFSTLEPAGPAAAQVAELWWVMFGGAMLILTGVTATALYSLKARRGGYKVTASRMLIGWGLIFPFATLTALMAFAFLRGEQLLARPDAGLLEVRAQARQWLWTFDYPGDIRTVGVLHVPAGERFHVRITSADVIHSLWVPRLGGKLDAMPGKENVIALKADEPGVYRGVCAEYCGIGHAHMMFEVHAHRSSDYRAALAAVGERVIPEQLPVLNQRRSPASGTLGEAVDNLLRWIGLR